MGVRIIPLNGRAMLIMQHVRLEPIPEDVIDISAFEDGTGYSNIQFCQFDRIGATRERQAQTNG